MRAVLLEFLTQCAARAGPSARAEDARRKSAAGEGEAEAGENPRLRWIFCGIAEDLGRKSCEHPVKIHKKSMILL